MPGPDAAGVLRRRPDLATLRTGGRGTMKTSDRKQTPGDGIVREHFRDGTLSVVGRYVDGAKSGA
jgi:hypothetical protein